MILTPADLSGRLKPLKVSISYVITTKLYFSRTWRTRAVRRSFVPLLILLSACTSSATTSETSSTDAPPVEESVVEEGQQEPAPVEEIVGETTETTAATVAPTDESSIYPASPLSNVTADLDGALLGVSTGLTRAERAPRFRSLEAEAGRQFDIGHVFHAWDQAIPTDDDLMHLEDGRILMISWNGTDTIEIQNGLHDDWIRTQATSVRELEQPVMLRWLWEMDANRRRDWVHSGEDFVGAWNHVRGIFDEVGADNAQFVWCPNEFLFWDADEGGGNPDEWYPGDDNVDWLCADGYNWQTSVDHPDWISFDRIFEDFVAWAEPRNLPIVIGETGSNEAADDAEGKGDWLRSLPGILENDLPAIDAVVYFDKDFTFNDQPDWRLDTTSESFAAWNDVANDPYFNPLAQ